MPNLRWITTFAVVLAALVGSVPSAADEPVVFRDEFERDDADEVGNGWSSRGTVVLKDGAAIFRSKEEEFRPRTRRTFPVQKEGTFTASFEMDWVREAEGTWGLFMQLGNSAEFPRFLVRETDLAKGVRVNLLWGGGDQVGGRPAGSFGYLANGKFEPLRVVNDAKAPESVAKSSVVTIDVDLDASTYRIALDGKTYADLPFESKGPVDTIRFIANGCSATGFSKSAIDDVRITKGQ